MKPCDWIQAHLDDFVDGELAPEAENELLEHIDGCDACRLELESLRSLLSSARALPERIEPRRDLWEGIESRIRVGVIRYPDWRRHARTAVFAAAVAAAVTVAVSIGFSTAPVIPEAVPTIAMEMEVDPFKADREELRRAYRVRAESLDPELRSVVDSNLTIIEASLAEIRLAMQESPDNPRWERMLRTACLSEVELLQQVIYNGLEG